MICFLIVCVDIGADIVDVTNQESLKFGKFRLENTWFELDSSQQRYFDQVARLNTHLREKYHALRDILWRAGYTNYFNDMPERYSIISGETWMSRYISILYSLRSSQLQESCISKLASIL